MRSLISLSEAVDVLRRLEPAAVRAIETESWKLTPARLRYLEDYGLHPTVPASGNATRLYGPVDVALLRLWVRLQHEGARATQVRYALAYLGNEIRSAIGARRALAIVIRGRRAELLSLRAAEAVASSAAAVVSLRDLLDGVSEAFDALRRERPELWAGWMYLTPTAAMEGREVVPS